MYLTDYHMHTNFSTDSQSPMEDMVKGAIEKGFNEICFCDHVDIGYPITPRIPNLYEQYNDCYALYMEMKEKYANKIKIRFGAELGYELTNLKENKEFAMDKDFDFLICSTHAIDNIDLYYGEFYIGKNRFDAYRDYFELVIKTIKSAEPFDVYGHIDYVNRYGDYSQKDLPFKEFYDYYVAAFKALIEKGKGIELNTSGFRYGLNTTHPQFDALKLYKSLGGEIVTLGSDAHRPSDIGAYFNTAYSFLKEAGFEAIAVYENRKPSWIAIK